ncbi:PEGA domain-containing protein [Stigmatella sp. ncwal1]|uniref:PEGA domain-containing protein n=1 Tax=Stigmatella ashevillensis TaxID=2995309 RepID=A0ABT5DBN0_9BACT|nr:PEGA domain-containing protein [Stigmatella ashevillena]MDC0709742.1 PEGA domain-containing protein [Stigmatella ashevillena]
MRRPWIRVLDAALSGLLVGLLAAGPAFAQQPPLRLLPRALPAAAAPTLTVVVVPLDAAARAQGPRLAYLAEQAVVGAGRFEWVRLADALEAGAFRSRQEKAAQAAAAFAEGQKAYDELDTQKALEQFDAAVQAYEASDLSQYFTDMSRARVMKVASHVANGDNKAAAREMADVLSRNPRAEFSSNYFPADERALAEKTRKVVLAEADKTLDIKTQPVSAQVFLDGQFQGSTPLRLSGLSRADHFVTVIAPGYALDQQRVSGSEVSFTLQPTPTAKRLREWVERIEDAPEAKGRDEALQALGTLAGTQQVLALLVRGTPGAGAQDAIALRMEVLDGHNLGYAAGPVTASGEAMEAGIQGLLASVLTADAPRNGGKPVRHFSAGAPNPHRRTAGYVLMATGAALLAGGIYFGLEASSKSDQFKGTPQTSARGESIRSDGKTFALIADLGILAGLGSAGAGAWLAFSEGGRGKKTAPASPAPARPPEAAPTEPPPPPPEPAVAPQAKPVEPAQDKQSSKKRAEEERRAREEAAKQERRTREEAAKQERRTREDAAKQEQLGRDEAAKRERDEAEQRKRQEEEQRKRQEEEQRKREEERRKREEEDRRKREEERKKRPALDEDDLRNY